MLSDSYAHGYGVRTDFIEALSYLERAAMAGSAATEAVLLRISDAVRERRVDQPRELADMPAGAFQVRQVFRDLEEQLAPLGKLAQLLGSSKSMEEYPNGRRSESRFLIDRRRGS